jgi:threonine aldolase
LEHNINRLADDHARAQRLAIALADIEVVDINVNHVPSNMIFFRLRNGLDPYEVVTRLDQQGVKMLAMKPGIIRAVTHLDVNDEQIEQTIAICREVLGKENGDLVI